MNQIRAAVIVALAVSGVTCNDLRVGSSNGRIVFNETIQASPAIWRQSQQVTINVSDHEYISCVMVTDNREGKDGEAKIVGGGEGYNNVTIELKSPAIFRGFDFHVVVYATEGNGQHIEGQQTVIDTQHPVINGQHPIVLTKDTDLNGKAKPETNNNAGDTKVTEKPLNGDKTPLATVEVPRINRHTLNQDPIVNFVKGKEINANESTDVTTEKVFTTQHNGLKVNNPVSVTPIVNEKKGDESNLKVNGPTTFHTEKTNVNGPTTTTTSTVAPKDADIKSTTEKFDSVSKELGQKVIYGIKNH